MFYNVSLFSVKSIFCIKLIASLFLILLIRQQQSTPWVFRIATLIKKSLIHYEIYYRHLIETETLYLKSANSNKYHTLDSLVLLTSLPSEK